MKTITDIMADFLDSIRAYEHESGKSIHFDERESSEFVDIYFNNGGILKLLGIANVSGGTFTIDDMKKAFMAGADKKYWTKIHLTGVVSGLDYELEPVFEKWFENYRGL